MYFGFKPIVKFYKIIQTSYVHSFIIIDNSNKLTNDDSNTPVFNSFVLCHQSSDRSLVNINQSGKNTDRITWSIKLSVI